MDVIEVERLQLPPGAAPGLSGLELMTYLPLILKVLAALASGTGTFSTATPLGKRWVRVQAAPFEE